MREIKFRMLVTSGDRPWHHWVFPQSIEYCKTAFNHYNLESWSQYTGLKDKNGVEIYEGDIVVCDGHRCEVVYQQSDCSFRYKPELSTDAEGNTHCYVMPYNDTEYIIGNIYENGDLLK